ncbi:MAG: DUF4292 domain-containing protein [Bryobacterales bacterium]|nr:DUF4292 domain-containing protein [Bryobacterales bacterium]
MDSPKRRSTLVCVVLTALTLVSATSCVVRRRVITRQGGGGNQALLTADESVLSKQVSERYSAIRTLNATVDMVPALGSVNKGKVTEYKDVRAYVLLRKPADIRIIGLYPVVRNKAFDMVSNGKQFELYVPARNRVIVGANEVRAPAKNKLENLRPQHFQEALIIEPVNPAREEAVLENLTDEENAAYILHILSRQAGGRLQLARNLWFDRLNLHLVRQQIFDASGDILTDARYREWETYDGIRFPKQIEINRPQDEYGVVMTVVKMDINKPLTDDKFALERPAGVQLQVLGEPPMAAEGRVSANGKRKN